MASAALKEKAMDYFTAFDDRQAEMSISYMETIDYNYKAHQKSLADLKGKIHFADGYDYKTMRSSQ